MTAHWKNLWNFDQVCIYYNLKIPHINVFFHSKMNIANVSILTPCIKTLFLCSDWYSRVVFDSCDVWHYHCLFQYSKCDNLLHNCHLYFDAPGLPFSINVCLYLLSILTEFYSVLLKGYIQDPNVGNSIFAETQGTLRSLRNWPSHISNLKATWTFSYPILRVRDFVRSYDKTSYLILKRSPVTWRSSRTSFTDME